MFVIYIITNIHHMYSIGALRSPDDFRDHIAEMSLSRQRSLVGLPETLNLRFKLPAIRNQGSQGTCAAQTAAAIREWQECVEFGYDKHMSPQFVYNLRSNYPSAGMYGRNVMDILLKNGICRESTYSYGTIEEPSKVSQTARNEASKHLIKEYARVTTLLGAKQSLYQTVLVIFHFLFIIMEIVSGNNSTEIK